MSGSHTAMIDPSSLDGSPDDRADPKVTNGLISPQKTPGATTTSRSAETAVPSPQDTREELQTAGESSANPDQEKPYGTGTPLLRCLRPCNTEPFSEANTGAGDDSLSRRVDATLPDEAVGVESPPATAGPTAW